MWTRKREETLAKNTNLKEFVGNSLVVQKLGLCTFTAEGLGSIPAWGTNPTSCAAVKRKTSCGSSDESK